MPGKAGRACRIGAGGIPEGWRGAMIDNFSLAISHGLMLLATWYLLKRPDLDREPSPRDETPPARPKRWGRGDA